MFISISIVLFRNMSHPCVNVPDFTTFDGTYVLVKFPSSIRQRFTLKVITGSFDSTAVSFMAVFFLRAVI